MSIEGATAENQAQMPSIWAKGCMLMLVCVLSDMTTPPWWRE